MRIREIEWEMEEAQEQTQRRIEELEEKLEPKRVAAPAWFTREYYDPEPRTWANQGRTWGE
jgi:hypothetical protein